MHYMKDRYCIAFALMAIVALGMRFFLAAHTIRYQGDALAFQQWFDLLRRIWVIDYYRVVDTSILAPYPPLSIYLFKAFSVLHVQTGMLITTIASIADVCIGGMIFFYFFNLQKKALALGASTAFLFNPAIMTVAAVWGQIDALYTAPLVFAFLALVMRKPILAAIAGTLSLFIKVQGLIFLPLLLACIAIFERKKLAPACCAMGITAGLIVAPFLFSGDIAGVIGVYANQAVGKYHFVTMNAWNVWWPVYQFVAPDTRTIFGIQYLSIGLILFGAAYATILLLLVKKKVDPIAAAVLLAFSFFMLPTEIHERYVFPTLALFPLLFSRGNIYRIFFGILSVVFFCNLFFVMIVQAHSLNVLNPFELFIGVFLISGWAINIIIFVKTFWLLTRTKLSRHTNE